MEKAKVTELLSNDGANLVGGVIETPPWRESGRGTVVASLQGSGALVSNVAVDGSHDGTNFVTIGTIALSASTTDTDVLAIDYPWPFLRATSSGHSGTTTKLRVTLAQ